MTPFPYFSHFQYRLPVAIALGVIGTVLAVYVADSFHARGAVTKSASNMIAATTSAPVVLPRATIDSAVFATTTPTPIITGTYAGLKPGDTLAVDVFGNKATLSGVVGDNANFLSENTSDRGGGVTLIPTSPTSGRYVVQPSTYLNVGSNTVGVYINTYSVTDDSWLASGIITVPGMSVTIQAPAHLGTYISNAQHRCTNDGPGSISTQDFVPETVEAPRSSNSIFASAEAAAEQISPGGGPSKATIAYFTIEKGTAYYMLDTQLNPWAGESISSCMITPLIDKTLLEFPQITNVVNDCAPSDQALCSN